MQIKKNSSTFNGGRNQRVQLVLKILKIALHLSILHNPKQIAKLIIHMQYNGSLLTQNTSH